MGDTKEWPTGKQHISFSELSNWIACPKRHQLQNIEKIDLYKASPYPEFGKALHDTAEHYLETRVLDKDRAREIIFSDWEKNGDSYRKGPFPDWCKNGYGDEADWIVKSDRILDAIPGFLEKEFPNWELVAAEELLYEKIDGLDLNFKGYIDAIIKVPLKNGKYKYYILDWKTCGNGWRPEKKRDFNVQLQLILYKHFWARKHGISLKDISLKFVLLKRDVKNPLKIVDTVNVSAGPKTISKGLKVINNCSASVHRKFFVKKKWSCTFCDYENTKYCP